MGAMIGSLAGFIASWAGHAFLAKPTGIPAALAGVPVAFLLTIIVSLFT